MSEKNSKTPKTQSELGRLIHVAKCFPPYKGWRFLFLREQKDSEEFRWFIESNPETEEPTQIAASSVEEALRLAHVYWRDQQFRCIRCGYRFTLPERDEIGTNALFHQMVRSYQSFNGLYVDEELGHPCIVREISQEAHRLWRSLEAQNRL